MMVPEARPDPPDTVAHLVLVPVLVSTCPVVPVAPVESVSEPDRIIAWNVVVDSEDSDVVAILPFTVVVSIPVDD